MKDASIIVSSKYFRKFLKQIALAENPENVDMVFTLKDGLLKSEGKEFSVEHKGEGEFPIYFEAIKRAIKVLKHIQEQPIKDRLRQKLRVLFYQLPTLMKPCHCGNTGYSKNLCRYHYALANPLKRSPIKKSAVRIKPVSKKRAKEFRVYEKEKAIFFETKEHCEFPGCEVENITLHHMAGRIGDKLTDRRYFKALCWMHHEWCETHPAEAKAMGLSLDRL